jgi:excisionase family DNA binding protein
MGTETVKRRLYTTAEARQLLNMGNTQLHERLKRGELRSVLLGTRRMIPAEEIDQFIARLREQQGAE